MFVKVFVFVFVALALTTSCFAQSAAKAQPNATRVDYQAQIQDASATVQAQIQALEAQIATASPQEQDNLQRQIQQTKQQGEIHRLEILLEWAQERGDAARITEIEQALNNWRNPPQVQQLPQLEKHASAAAATQSESQPSGK